MHRARRERRSSFSSESPFIGFGTGSRSSFPLAGRTTNLLFHKKRLAVLVSSAAMANITREEGEWRSSGRKGWSCSGVGGGRYINGEFGHDSPRKVSNEGSIKQSFRAAQKGRRGKRRTCVVCDGRQTAMGFAITQESSERASKLLLDPLSESRRADAIDLVGGDWILPFFLPACIVIWIRRMDAREGLHHVSC